MINVVAAFITDNNQFLIAQRKNGHLKNLWEFPGGKVEPNETRRAAVVREIKEELCINVEIVKKISVFKHIYSFAEIELTLFHCKIKGRADEVLIQGSHQRIAWVDYNILGLELAPLDKKILEYLKKNYVI